MSAVASGLTIQERRELLAELLQLGRHRQLFPVLDSKLYLNYGAQGPLPTPAVEAVQRFYQSLDAAAPMTIDGTLTTLDELRRTRAALASLLGTEPERLALVDNTSMGCNIVLWGLDWRPGDRLLLGDHEYPGVVAAARQVARRFGAEVDLLPTDVEPDRLLAGLESRLTPQTRLVVLSHVLWDTGRLLPLPEILALCRDRGARVLIDGAQSIGALPVDLSRLGADFYAFPGHKWCCGPEGVGGLWVDPAAGDALTPPLLGPRSFRMEAGGGWELHADARRFETSTFPVALCAGLRAALELHDGWGSREARWQRIRRLARLLWEHLGEVPGVDRLQPLPPETGLVFFRLRTTEPAQDRLVRFLETRGILIRAIPHLDCLRVSVHYLTQEKEIERLTEELHRYPTASR